MVSAFLFYKDIENFVYNADLAGTGEWVDFAEANTFANGDNADLWGLELAYSAEVRLAAGTLERPAAGRQRHLQPLRRQHQRL